MTRDTLRRSYLRIPLDQDGRPYCPWCGALLGQRHTRVRPVGGPVRPHRHIGRSGPWMPDVPCAICGLVVPRTDTNGPAIESATYPPRHREE